MVGEFSKTSYTSLNDIQCFTLSERGPHLFHSPPIRIDPLLNVSNGFVLPVRFEQMPELVPQREVLFNRLTLGNVGVGDCSPRPWKQNARNTYFLSAAWSSPACAQTIHMAAAGSASSLDWGMPFHIARNGHTALPPA